MGNLTETSVYAHDTGILIPRKTGVGFEVQCDGVMCNHVTLEGVYLPIRQPWVNHEDVDGFVYLFDELSQWNYSPGVGNTQLHWESLGELWHTIKERMPFKYRESDPPDGYTHNREAIKWIEILGHKKRENDSLERNRIRYNWPERLKSETVALIYPNSD